MTQIHHTKRTISLLAGPRHFIVSEIPAYEPTGDGEHLYVHIEKEGLNTDAVAKALASCCGRREMDIGYAGRKDRHAITRQWFSVHFGREEQLVSLADKLRGGRIDILAVSRHRNKLRLGHLIGNRFQLGLGIADDATTQLTVDEFTELHNRTQELSRHGLVNRFGPQRFGINGATLAIAQAWAQKDFARAVERIVDPLGQWHLGETIPDRWYGGPEGRIVASLRRHPLDAGKALKMADDRYRKLVASAGQSAIFNAVVDARIQAGLLHSLRQGDIGCNTKGAPFMVTEEEAASTSARCAPGILDAFATGPLPGTSRLQPSAAIVEEEKAWSSGLQLDWECFSQAGVFNSPGERRPVVVSLLQVPVLQRNDKIISLELQLGSGCYATSALGQMGIVVPADRRDS